MVEKTTKQIAAEISAHLQRFEKAAKPDKGGLKAFYQAGAWEDRGRVGVRYVGYQGSTYITRIEAAYYLDILDRGFVGRHFEAFREFGEPSGTAEKKENLFRLAQENYRPEFTDGHGKPQSRLTKAYYTLLEKITRPVEMTKMSRTEKRRISAIVPDIGEFYPTGVSPEIRSASPEVQQAFNGLFVEISRALGKATLSGQQGGVNLLTQLARGKITVEQFNATKPGPGRE